MRIWVIAVMTALILYLGSEAPVKHWCMKNGHRRMISQISPAGIDHIMAPPLGVENFYQPADWLIEHAHLDPLADRYDRWWRDLLSS